MSGHRGTVHRIIVPLILALLPAVAVLAQETQDEAMDAVLKRLYATKTQQELYKLDQDDVFDVLTPKERKVFATKHWCFDVNVPVVVSIMHNVEQKTLPFWLKKAGFKKTDMVVKLAEDEPNTYEVWQKKFRAGRVELGINGFDSFTLHYFVCVAPKRPDDTLELSNFYPEDQTVLEMKKGSMVYHDWTELAIIELPDELVGQKLLTTHRGRGKEAGLVSSFRKTPFLSSTAPDPVYLTWSEDPRTTQNVQWRTSEAVKDGVVRYREKDASDFMEASATCKTMEDRMLANDRVCNWFTTVLQNLKPATTYEYQAGSPTTDTWSDVAEFTTAPEVPTPFSFFHCSDTHSNEKWGDLMAKTFTQYPDTDFCMISGDLVGTGMEREDWDTFLEYGEPVFRTRPVMPAIGNHDAQLGLGAGMYLDIFGLPENGPKENLPETAYSFKYSNAEFFVLDVMSPTEPQRVWLDQQLAKSDATWKIAMFHFPLYDTEEAYPHLVNAWATLFDKYHVDLVLTGHVHRYMRTYPIRAGEPVDSTQNGTVYITSVSIPGRPLHGEKPSYTAVRRGGGSFCNLVSIDGNRLTYRAITIDGEIRDDYTIEK